MSVGLVIFASVVHCLAVFHEGFRGLLLAAGKALAIFGGVVILVALLSAAQH
jgi:hypothetical protein